METPDIADITTETGITSELTYLPDYPPQQLANDRELERLLLIYKALCPNEDGIWSCEEGAVVLAWLCDQLGIERELRSGVYWHPDIESYNVTMGYEPGSLNWAEWRDEVHCWVEVERPYGTVLIDSNPERLPGRPTRKAWLFDPVRNLLFDVGLGREGEWIENPFEARNNVEVDMVGFEPDEDIEELARDTSFSHNLAGILERGRKLLAMSWPELNVAATV